ncbi:hypothetical protein AKJ16_DCAP21057 [Drosera capensis]
MSFEIDTVQSEDPRTKILKRIPPKSQIYSKILNRGKRGEDLILPHQYCEKGCDDEMKDGVLRLEQLFFGRNRGNFWSKLN